MQDVYTITPHIIERWVIADKVEVASVPGPEDGCPALLMFTDEDEAERFRRETGRYPADAGCEVVYVDLDGLRNLIHTWGYRSVAVVGLEPDGRADFFDAETFCELLEDAEEE
jgi:hypothetical protein